MTPWALATALVLASPLLAPALAQTGTSTSRSQSLAHADSLFRSGKLDEARRAYGAIFAADPGNSRAVYQLGVLEQGRPGEALGYFTRYTALEPADPWGLMAGGDVLLSLGRDREAADWYRRAALLAPAERDAVIGRARILFRTGRTEQAIVAYQRWLQGHPRDGQVLAEAARALLRAGRARESVSMWQRAAMADPALPLGDGPALARAAAAPAIESGIWTNRDSDANSGRTLQMGADIALSARTRGGIRLTAADVRDGVDVLGSTEVMATAVLRPVAPLHIETALGVTRLPGVTRLSHELIAPTGSAKLRWVAPGGTLRTEAVVRRDVLRASPLLLANRVVRQDAKGMLEVAVAGRLRLRGMGRIGTLVDRYDRNTRAEMNASTVINLSSAAEISLRGGWAGFDRSSASGYYAPRGVQTLQLASYLEVEPSKGWTIAADVSGGMQRIANQGMDYGGWREALGLYGLVGWSPVPMVQFNLEIEAYDAAIAPNALSAAGQWQYGSLGLGMRYSL